MFISSRVRKGFSWKSTTAGLVGTGMTIISLVFPYLGWDISQLDARILFFFGITLLILGAVFFIRGIKKSPSQNHLQEIPEILTKMHKRLTTLAEQEAVSRPIDISIIEDDYLELLDINESKYPKLKQITATSDANIDRKIIQEVMDKFIEEHTKQCDEVSLLIKIGGLLNIKGMGIAKMKDYDRKYSKLHDHLICLRYKISGELSETIDNYLQYSIGLNTIYLILTSLCAQGVPNMLPAKAKAEVGAFGERTDIAMNELLAEVVDTIKESERKKVNDTRKTNKEAS